MKKIYLLLITVFIFSCKENKENAFYNADNKCECEKTLETDSIFYASNVEIDTNLSKDQIKFNCQLIDVAIASVTDNEGNEKCTNMYDLKCSSNEWHRLTLAEDFNYTSDDAEYNVNSKISFIENLQRENGQTFKFYLNSKRELKSASRILKD